MPRSYGAFPINLFAFFPIMV
uniref:Uncharacterized protein n=1 Tax=Anguilla anguilla TaxID=7936 RepID=A0A0E9VND4_ANGAN